MMERRRELQRNEVIELLESNRSFSEMLLFYKTKKEVSYAFLSRALSKSPTTAAAWGYTRYARKIAELLRTLEKSGGAKIAAAHKQSPSKQDKSELAVPIFN